MNPISGHPSTRLIQLEECQDDIQSKVASRQMVLFTAPTRVKTWPNLHSLFTVATLVSSVALLIFPNPVSIGINTIIRCVSTAFSIYAMNKAKISTDLLGVVAILIAKNAAVVAIALDIVFEGINFSRCAVSCEFLKSRFIRFLPETKKKQPLDINRFIQTRLTRNPKDPYEACKILSIPLDRIDDQDFIEIRYNSRNRETLLKNKRNLDAMGSPFALQIQRQIDYRDTAYKTLKERNESNSK